MNGLPALHQRILLHWRLFQQQQGCHSGFVMAVSVFFCFLPYLMLCWVLSQPADPGVPESDEVNDWCLNRKTQCWGLACAFVVAFAVSLLINSNQSHSRLSSAFKIIHFSLHQMQICLGRRTVISNLESNDYSSWSINICIRNSRPLPAVWISLRPTRWVICQKQIESIS